MAYCAFIYKPDGTSSLTIYLGEGLRVAKRHARFLVESGLAVGVTIADRGWRPLMAIGKPRR